MIFEKKKIQTETLSEYLTAIRNNSGLALSEVAQKTGIKPQFLSALEEGNLKRLPPDVYVLGFLRQLAAVYSMDADILISQYKKEKNIHNQLHKNKTDNCGSWWQQKIKQVVLTPKNLSVSLGILFICLTVGYIVWQVWSINKTPGLEIFEPANNSVVSGATVTVRGQTDPGLTVTINDESIYVDNKGGFTKQLSLNPGQREITITAKNRFGKISSQTLNITGAATSDAAVSSMELKADFTGLVNLSVDIDNQPTQTWTFNSGDSKTFSAKDKIIISTSDAGATKITLNGQNMGAMGRSKEILNNISFFASSANATSSKQ